MTLMSRKTAINKSRNATDKSVEATRISRLITFSLLKVWRWPPMTSAETYSGRRPVCSCKAVTSFLQPGESVIATGVWIISNAWRPSRLTKCPSSMLTSYPMEAGSALNLSIRRSLIPRGSVRDMEVMKMLSGFSDCL